MAHPDEDIFDQGVANGLAVVLDVSVGAEARQDASMGGGPGSGGPPPPPDDG